MIFFFLHYMVSSVILLQIIQTMLLLSLLFWSSTGATFSSHISHHVYRSRGCLRSAYSFTIQALIISCLYYYNISFSDLYKCEVALHVSIQDAARNIIFLTHHSDHVISLSSCRLLSPYLSHQCNLLVFIEEMSTSSYSQPKRSISITYLLIFQADMTHDFSGAIPQSLEDHPANIHTSYSLSFFTSVGIPHFVVLIGMWFTSWCSKATTAHAEHNYFVVSLCSLIRLHLLPTFKVQPHVKRTGTFF